MTLTLNNQGLRLMGRTATFYQLRGVVIKKPQPLLPFLFLHFLVLNDSKAFYLIAFYIIHTNISNCSTVGKKSSVLNKKAYK